MLPTSTYCSKFIVSSNAANSCCKTDSNVVGTVQITRIRSAISCTLSIFNCASGAICSVISACAGINAFASSNFTISSVCGIGGTYFSPIVNAPEVAILGVSKSSMKPVWNGKEFVPRLIVPLSLSADHRVIDGALATRFNAYIATLLADMRRVLV